jgi:hypothetical protein
MSNDTIEINASNLDASLEELSDRADAEAPADFMVRCNTCGWRRPRSVSEPCPSGHVSGFSYAGPLEEADPEMEAIAKEDGDEPLEMTFTQDLSEPEDEGPSPEDLADDMGSIAVEKSIMHMFDVQDRLDSAIEDHGEKAEVAKTAKKRVESLQEDLSVAVRAVREARASREPDPDRYPLLDGPKAAINATFAKPEAIQPLPADTAEEFYRRKKRDARFADLGLKPKVVEILEGAGYRTVLDLEKLHEANADLVTIRSDAGKITEKRAEEIRDAIGKVAVAWLEEWIALHPDQADPESNVPESTDPAPPDGDGEPPLEDPNSPVGPALPATES